MKKIHTIIIILASYIFYNPLLAAINATIQNGTVFTTDDIIELLVTTNNPQDQIDASTLGKDFKVLSQGKQVSHTIMNGNASTKIQWIIGLQANKTGTLVIPSLRVGNDLTQPITLTIKNSSSSTEQTAEIFMQVEANDQSVYVNAPLAITINIYISADITARNLELNAEESPSYVLYKLSESNKQVFHQDRRYNLFQVKYLGFYTAVGKHSLPQFSLSGVKLKNTNKHHDIFSLYQQQWLPFSRNNPNIPVNILPPPPGFNLQNWLPAEAIFIQEKWSAQTTDVPVGEAIQRVITIAGINVPADQLPIFLDANKPGNYSNNKYKIYIDKPELVNSIESNKLNSTLTQKITYITTTPGPLELPEHKFTWWNVKSSTKQEIVLPVKTFNVTATGGANANNPSPLSALPSKDIPSVQFEHNVPANNQAFSKMHLLLIGIIFLLSFIIGYLIWIIRKTQNTDKSIGSHNHTNFKANTSKKAINRNVQTSIKRLKLLAGKNNKDYESLYKELNHLADLCFCQTSTNKLNKLNSLIDNLPQLHQQNINSLMGMVYSNNTTTWDAKFFTNEVLPELEKIANNFLRKDSHSVKKLTGLYPE